jgi:hypothetical protein
MPRMEAVSARGREMAKVSMEDNGAMAAVFGPLDEIQRTVDAAEGYAVVANINSYNQAVVGGATKPPSRRSWRQFSREGHQRHSDPGLATRSTPQIVAPASRSRSSTPCVGSTCVGPKLPIVANVTGEFYPADASTETMLEILGQADRLSRCSSSRACRPCMPPAPASSSRSAPRRRCTASSRTSSAATHDDVLALFTNFPKLADDAAFNQALCGLYAAGLGLRPAAPVAAPVAAAPVAAASAAAPVVTTSVSAAPGAAASAAGTPSESVITELGKLFAGVLEQGMKLYGFPGGAAGAPGAGDTAYPVGSNGRI